VSTSAASPVLLTREGGVATLTLNRPEALNAINVPVAEAFLAQCQAIANDPSVRVVVLRGEGKAFGVGGDLATLQTDSANSANALISRLHASVPVSYTHLRAHETG
jgi:2-(1,2-epoxy-1,2-dihydrophenyl)acetyl-CoA isomerase